MTPSHRAATSPISADSGQVVRAVLQPAARRTRPFRGAPRRADRRGDRRGTQCRGNRVRRHPRGPGGELENRDDDDAIAEFNRVYERWHEATSTCRCPAAKAAGTSSTATCRWSPTYGCVISTITEWTEDIVLVSHGAAIRLVSAQLAGVDNSFVLDHHLANTDAVMLAPITDGRWSCVHWGSAHRRSIPSPTYIPSKMRSTPQTRWVDIRADRPQTAVRRIWSSHSQPAESPIDDQRMQNQIGSGQPVSVHSARCHVWRMRVPWQCSCPSRHSRQSPMDQFTNTAITDSRTAAQGRFTVFADRKPRAFAASVG